MITLDQYLAKAEHLSQVIQSGDVLIAASGKPIIAQGNLERHYNKAILQWHRYEVMCLVADWFTMSIRHDTIEEVWREGILIYKDGETLMQRSMF